DRFAVDLDAFIETLGDLHGAGGRKAELARSFLLKRRGGERRRRVAANRLRLNRRNGVVAGLQRSFDAPCRSLIGNIEAAEFLAVSADDAGDKTAAARGLKGDLDRPVFARLECLDLVF